MAGFTKQQLEYLTFQPENLASIKDAVQETFHNAEATSSFVLPLLHNSEPTRPY